MANQVTSQIKIETVGAENVAFSLCDDSSLRSLNTQIITLENSFPIGCPYKWLSQPLDPINVFDSPCPQTDWLYRLQG